MHVIPGCNSTCICITFAFILFPSKWFTVFALNQWRYFTDVLLKCTDHFKHYESPRLQICWFPNRRLDIYLQLCLFFHYGSTHQLYNRNHSSSLNKHKTQLTGNYLDPKNYTQKTSSLTFYVNYFSKFSVSFTAVLQLQGKHCLVPLLSAVLCVSSSSRAVNP